MLWIALEPWLDACPCIPLTRVFQIGVGEILLGRFKLYDGGNLRRSDFDHLNLFQGQKQYSVNIENWLKSKMARPGPTMSMKLKWKWYSCNGYIQKWSF